MGRRNGAYAATLLTLVACESILDLRPSESRDADGSDVAFGAAHNDATCATVVADAGTAAADGPSTAEAMATPNGGLPPPVAYWPLDTNDYVAPRTVLGRIGGLGGFFAGPQDRFALVGQVGQSLQLSDTDVPRYSVVVPPRADDPLELSDAGTISAWVRFSTLPSERGHQMALVDKGGFNTDETLMALQFTLPDGGTRDGVEFAIGGPSESTGAALGSDTVIQTGVWHHIVGTFAAAGSLCLYVDGVVQMSCVMTYGPRRTDVQPLRLGDRAYFGSSALDGQLDEVAIWNVQLTATQVQTLYQLGLSRTPLVPP
jgi:hypothetical protein